MTVAARREAVHFLVVRGLSRRRARVLLPRHRSTFGDQVRPDRHADVAEQAHALAQRYPRGGYRRVWAWLRRRGQRVNKKPGHRLWTRAKLPVRTVTRQRGPARAAGVPVPATHPRQGWTDDVRHDHGLKGTPLPVVTVMDACTREGLALEVATSWPWPRGRTVLERLVATHGAPQGLRSDHGPEFIARAVRGWLAPHPMATLDIDPGCPWQNGAGERGNGTGRDECLHLPVFHSVAEARLMLEADRRPYHAERPHRRLGSQTPVAFTRDWLAGQASSIGR